MFLFARLSKSTLSLFDLWLARPFSFEIMSLVKPFIMAKWVVAAGAFSQYGVDKPTDPLCQLQRELVPNFPRGCTLGQTSAQ